ncbi:vacuolar import and degradation protein-domain-containing protein [Aspergillus coremiiformis]|uniref:Vacuolar import and degradation protein-domain-containing protein n=1 Tax=Aspergillus coremiiformis TaxID=138285 RepID=A0A5N6YVC3_9EURO|nr:vacuolar import and degradation protein-domain-containing protein [Aspergillus coremiiformis]
MPPANSPLQDTSHSPPSVSSLQQLSAVSIPVPSLPTSVADDVHDDNVSFLRSRVRSPPDSSSSLSRQRRRRQQQILPEVEADSMDVDDPTDLRTSVEINRRIPILRRQNESSNSSSNNNNNNSDSMPNYEGRISNPRSLYGWAPTSDDDEEEEDDNVLAYGPLQDNNNNNSNNSNNSNNNNNTISSWFGRLSDRNPPSRRHMRHDPVNRDPHTFLEAPPESNTQRLSDYSPLSTTEALLQTVRRQPRFSRTRTLHNYLLDRERASQDSDESRERLGAASTSRAYRFLPSSRGEPHRLLTHNELRARVNAHRQLHMDNPPSPRLKETIKYLDRLRYSNSFEESLTSAAAGGFVRLDFLPWDEDDFILDTASIAPPPVCSWLQPGMVFSGSQRAASNANSFSAQRLPNPSSHDPLIVNGSEQNGSRIPVHTSSGRRYMANNIYNLGTGREENWPVKVTIHNINLEEMTLSGTMEAYNIPDKSSPSHDAHIVTFLEGEIIDFNTHTLETKNFKADAEIDCTYWRELQPFKNLSDEAMTRNLVSRKWITEELSKGWILMRWKERCFITPTDSRQGLTISGFYYISLHRESGHIEGLYYDPGSSPYQQLTLKPESKRMVRPSYSFR